MAKEETLYTSIGQKIKDAEQRQIFGKPCLKINEKAFICFFQNEMVKSFYFLQFLLQSKHFNSQCCHCN